MKLRWLLSILLAVLLQTCLSPSVEAKTAFKNCEIMAEEGLPRILACNVAIANAPKDPSLYFYRGWEYENTLKNYDEAVADYSMAIRLSPNNGLPLYARGNAYSQLGKSDLAINDYTQALKYCCIDKSNVYFNRADEWRRKGDYNKSITDYDQSIKLNAKDASAFVNRGNVRMMKGEFSKAVADYTEALRLSPKNANAIENLNIALSKQKNQNRPTDYISTSSNKKRVALVIGNSAYENVPTLENPSRDAMLLGKTLRDVGFDDVLIKLNLTRQQMLDEIKAFEKNAINADWAAIYYAGHGIEVGGMNYLIPIDAQKTNQNSVSIQTINLQYLLNAVEVASNLRLLIIDACRNNPYAQQVRSLSSSRGVGEVSDSSVGRGLSRVEPQPGTLVVYSAKAGEFALDGDGNNSPFVTALVARIEQKPAIEVRRLFDFVREDVFSITRKEQQPFAYGSLTAKQDFYFTSK